MCCGGITRIPLWHHKTRHQIPHLSQGHGVADVVRGQFGTCSSNSTVPLFRHHHHVLRWDWRSDPPSGTIRQGFNQTTHTYQGRNQCQTWFGANSAHAASFQLFRHHHHVLRWDWHFRSTLWYHKTRFHIQTTTPIPGTQPVSQTWFRDPFGTCSSNSTFQLFRHHHHVLRWIGTSDPPSGTIRQGFHINYPHLSWDATSVADVVRGQFGTCSSNSTVPIVPPPPPCAAVGLALQIHPLVP
jgi:hypothetical protein